MTKKVFQLKEWEKPYKILRKHLDKMPVGFPPTFSGVELRLLKMMFTISEAQVAICLDYKTQPLETIFKKQSNTEQAKIELGLDWVGRPDDLDTLLEQSDYIVLCLPLNHASHGIINKRTLRLMKSK